MTNSLSFTQKVANFGFYPPQDHDQTIEKGIANDQREGTHFSNMGCDGNGSKTNYLKQEKSGEQEPKKGPLESENEKGTFWTVCPYCYRMYEYEKKYEECCLRCQNCRKGFHGLAVAAPPESVLVNGKGGECYYGYGIFPLGYSGNSFSSDKKEVGGGDTGEKKQVVVEISDDSDDDIKEMDVKNEAGKVKAEGFSNGEEGRIAMKNRVKLKSVLRNTKKMMGRGVKVTIEKVSVMETNEDFWNEVADIGCENEGIKLASDQNGGSNEDELGFSQGDDIFVDLRDIV